MRRFLVMLLFLLVGCGNKEKEIKIERKEVNGVPSGSEAIAFRACEPFTGFKSISVLYPGRRTYAYRKNGENWMQTVDIICRDGTLVRTAVELK